MEECPAERTSFNKTEIPVCHNLVEAIRLMAAKTGVRVKDPVQRPGVSGEGASCWINTSTIMIAHRTANFCILVNTKRDRGFVVADSSEAGGLGALALEGETGCSTLTSVRASTSILAAFVVARHGELLFIKSVPCAGSGWVILCHPLCEIFFVATGHVNIFYE